MNGTVTKDDKKTELASITYGKFKILYYNL